jgi:uncharacterized protein
MIHPASNAANGAVAASVEPSLRARRERVVAIDVLRGFALLGILVMNIQAFAMPIAAYFNPFVYGAFDGADRAAWFATRLFFDVKFLSIFSTLFGASLVLAGEGERATRRLQWLVVFGLVHGYLLFVGDILFTYGVVGLVVMRAHEWTIARQAKVGLALVASGSVLHAVLGVLYPHLPAWGLAEIDRVVSGQDVAEQLEVFRSGWLAQLLARAALCFSNQVEGTLVESGWQSAGCMLLGMAAVRARFFDGETRLHRLGPPALALGLAVTAAGIAVGLGGAFGPRAWLFAQALHLAGCVGVAFGLVVAIVTLARAPWASRVATAVARLGRVAFSAYILQSIAGLFVFGGQGLGLYGTWGRAYLFVAPFAFWLFELALAALWTARFRFGPLEALWRGLYRGDFSLGSAAPGAAEG